MAIKFSPWGHKLNRLKAPVSARHELELTYDLLPFEAPQWQFIRRLRRIDDDWQNVTLEGDAISNSSYVPDRDDPLVFRSSGHYEQILNDIKSISDWLDKQLATAGFPAEAAQNLAANPALANDYLRLTSTDKRALEYLISESDPLRKFTIQRIHRAYWYVEQFTPNNVPVTRDQAAVLTSLMTSMKAQSAGGKLTWNELKSLADPLTTNSGAPYFTSGISGRLRQLEGFRGIVAELLRDDAPRVKLGESALMLPEALITRLNTFAHELSIPIEAALAVGANMRTGPSRKPGLIFQPAGDDLVAHFELSNCPRTRAVFMVSYLINLLLISIFRALKTPRLKNWYWAHDSHALQIKRQVLQRRASAGDSLFFELDVSGLDRTMSNLHKKVLFDEAGAKLTKGLSKFELELANQVTHLPFITPDPFSGESLFASMLCIPKQAGAGLYSGVKFTSELDSYMVMWAALSCYVKNGLISHADIQANRWAERFPIFNLGDDVLMHFNNTKDFSAVTGSLTESFSQFGLKAVTSIGDRFLMKHYGLVPSGSAPEAVLSRILQQTIANEHVRRDASIFALGLWSRFTGFRPSAGGRMGPKFGRVIKQYQASVREVLMSLPAADLIASAWDASDDARAAAIARIGSDIIAKEPRDAGPLSTLQQVLLDDRFSSSAQQILEQLEASGLGSQLNAISDKEARFLHFALRTLHSTLV